MPQHDLKKLGWKWRPSRWVGVAIAGGLAIGILAVIFGPHIYQVRGDRVIPSTTSEIAPSAIHRQALPTIQSPAGPAVNGTHPSPVSARALFYGTQSARDDRKLLGLRYSFLTRTADGHENEVDAATAATGSGPVRISIETNRDAFLQILQSLGSAGTRLWWPPQETGKISLKILPGKRSEIPLPPPAEGGLLHIMVRLSLKPFAPLTMQEVGMLDRFETNLLSESVTPGQAGTEEHATYVVSQDSSQTVQMTMSIPIRQ